MPAWACSRNPRSVLRRSSGSSAPRVSAASPSRVTSVAPEPPKRAGSVSIWTALTLAGSGTLAAHGKLVPTSSRVSAPSRASSDGRVPSTPMQPVVEGWSSGTAALPGRDLTTGAATASATASSSSRASSPPAPTSRATRAPWLSTPAARSRSASGGMPGPAVNSGAVGGVPVGVVSIHGLVSDAVSSRPGGKVMCDTVPLARAWPIPMSTTAGICTGTLTRTL